jgi:hypothetical protein
MLEIRRSISLLSFMLALLFFVVPTAMAEVLVIGNIKSPVPSLGEKQVKYLYLTIPAYFSDGTLVAVVDLSIGNEIRDEFYSKIFNMSSSRIKSIMAKRAFKGDGPPPDTRASESAVVRWVAEAPGRVGYVSGVADISSVKVLMRRK